MQGKRSCTPPGIWHNHRELPPSRPTKNFSKTDTHLKPTPYGSLWMRGAGVFFAIMGVCVKLGAARYSTSELVFYRSLFGFLTIWGITQSQGLRLSTPRWRMHLSRSLVGFVSLLLFFYAITAMPLATAVTLNYTSPLFLAVLVTLLLRESIKPLFLCAGRAPLQVRGSAIPRIRRPSP